jgi:hypothetical protein
MIVDNISFKRERVLPNFIVHQPKEKTISMSKVGHFCFLLLLTAPALYPQSTVGGRLTVGTFANRPTTCSAGDLYSASDTILMYVCGPANTWTAVPSSTASNTFSGAVTFTGQILCKNFENVRCVDSTNSAGWTPGSDIGAWINDAEADISTTVSGFKSGKIIVSGAASVQTTTVTLSPFVQVECESANPIDYQGTGVAFLFTTETGTFNYAGTGGLDGCNLTNSTNNATALVELQNTTEVHLRNTIINGGGTGTSACLLFNGDGSNHWTEQSDLNRVFLQNCASPIEFTVTNGATGSFAYTRWRGVTVVPAVGGTAGVLALNNSLLGGSDLEFNAFLPNNAPGLWLRNTAEFNQLSALHIQCELQSGATVSNCIKTDTGTFLTSIYSENESSGTGITDSIASGTIAAYIWLYGISGASFGQADSTGLLLGPNGTAAGYACGSNCGDVGYDTNSQTAGTYLHLQPPANLGNVTRTFALLEQTNNAFSGSLRGTQVIADQGIACTNAELTLSPGWGNTKSVTGVVGTGQTCEWTITAGGTGIAANPSISDTLTNQLPSANTVCEMRMVGGTGAATLIDQTTLSATAPAFTFSGTPMSGSTYKVVRRCGP